MQQDPKAKEGDLAVVYNTLFTDIYFGVSFSAMLIPKVINISTTSETGRTLIANSTGEDYGNFSCYIPAFETGSEQTLNIVLQNSRKRMEILKSSSDGFYISEEDLPDEIWAKYGNGKYYLSNFGRVRYKSHKGLIIPQRKEDGNLYLDKEKWEEKQQETPAPAEIAG